MNQDQIPRASFSVREFGEAQALGYVKTYEYVMAGKIRSYRVGRRRLIPASELTEFPARQLAEQQQCLENERDG